MSGTLALRVGFAGTPAFAATALAAILARGWTVPLVLTQPDRPAGRGLKLQASPVKLLAQAHGCAVLQPAGLRLDGRHAADAAAARAALLAADLDVLVVAAYGLILPRWVLDLPRRGCLNIHASLLPRWRGAAPIHRALEAGDARTGTTIMQMDEGLDTGAMRVREALDIHPDDTTTRLHDRLAEQGARLIVATLAGEAGQTLTPQPAEGVTYAHKIDKAEARADWTLPAAQLERRVRAFDPFPGVQVEVDGETVKLWSARVVEGRGAPGEVLEAGPDRCVVACGEGALEWLQVQRPGGRRIGAAEWQRARPLAAGTRL